jgi:kinesin family protein 3/17
LKEEQQREREDLLETVRQLTSEIKLKQAIIEGFIPSQEQQIIYDCAEYDPASEKWKILQVHLTGNNFRSGKRNDNNISNYSDHEELDSSSQGLDWDPMIAFASPYLSYDVPGLKVKKGGLDKLKMRSQKTSEKGDANTVKAPTARGLIAKKKHYA